MKNYSFEPYLIEAIFLAKFTTFHTCLKEKNGYTTTF